MCDLYFYMLSLIAPLELLHWRHIPSKTDRIPFFSMGPYNLVFNYYTWKRIGQTPVRLVSVFICYASNLQKTSQVLDVGLLCLPSLFLTLKTTWSPSESSQMVCCSGPDFRVCVWD